MPAWRARKRNTLLHTRRAFGIGRLLVDRSDERKKKKEEKNKLILIK